MATIQRTTKWDQEEIHILPVSHEVREDLRVGKRNIHERLEEGAERIGRAFIAFFPYL
jgi:hypothetical protein